MSVPFFVVAQKRFERFLRMTSAAHGYYNQSSEKTKGGRSYAETLLLCIAELLQIKTSNCDSSRLKDPEVNKEK